MPREYIVLEKQSLNHPEGGAVQAYVPVGGFVLDDWDGPFVLSRPPGSPDAEVGDELLVVRRD